MWFSVVDAAQLNLTSQTQEIYIGQPFQVNLTLDTENEEINAIGGKIVFPSELELKEIRDGGSIVNFWIEEPNLKSKSYILYSGITPGGFIGGEGFIFSMVFVAKNAASGTIDIQDAQALLNDGKGMPAKLKISPLQFSISQEVSVAPPIVETLKDTEPPEEFKPEIAQSPEIFDGKYFLVFATQDKRSGIDHYEIYEDLGFRIQDLGKMIKQILYPKSYIQNYWNVAESPYLLKDQKLRSFIYVKAVDKAGNERIEVVEPHYPLKWYERPLVWIMIILIGIILYIILYLIRKILWKR